jgi:hypothetical protein
MKQLDINKTKSILAILKTHKDTFHISDAFLEEMETLCKSKTDNAKTIILRPLLNDLFEEHAFKLVEEGVIYYIPLWHHELVYDVNGNELCVEINPIVDKNIEIDSNNNIIVYKQLVLSEIWIIDEIEVKIGARTMKIPRNELKMRYVQQFVFTGHGIPYISTHDIYDVSKKMNIIVIIIII